MQLKIKGLFLQFEHFEGLSFTVGTLRLNEFAFVRFYDDLSIKGHIVLLDLTRRFSNCCVLFALVSTVKIILFGAFVLAQLYVHVIALFFFSGSIVVI